jgi:hypothetical protein
MQFTTVALASLFSMAYALPQMLARQGPPATEYTVTNLTTVCEGVVPSDCFYNLYLSDSNTNPCKYYCFLLDHKSVHEGQLLKTFSVP